MSDDKDESKLTGHDYDGIQEYDNPLPNWWLMTFFGTIIFAFIYWIHYEFAGGPSLAQEFKSDMALVEAQSQSAGKNASNETEDSLAALLKDPTIISKGKEIYNAKCAVCHGNELQGGIGPNLVDEYWLHGKGYLLDILMVARKGVLEKGMPAWETMLKDDELKSVVAYVASLQGSQPANPKPAQGEKSVRKSP